MIRQLAVTLHLLGLQLGDRLDHAVRSRCQGDPDRGSVTIEQVAWAVAIIAIVGIAVAAIKSYITAQAGKLS